MSRSEWPHFELDFWHNGGKDRKRRREYKSTKSYFLLQSRFADKYHRPTASAIASHLLDRLKLSHMTNSTPCKDVVPAECASMDQEGLGLGNFIVKKDPNASRYMDK